MAGITTSSYTVYRGSGQSMSPVIEPGDTYICDLKPGKIKKNDIIVYYKQELDKTINHRVVKVLDNSTYLTKGDNNTFHDNYSGNGYSYTVDRSEIICRYVQPFFNSP